MHISDERTDGGDLCPETVRAVDRIPETS